jgi:hypothetical protein
MTKRITLALLAAAAVMALAPVAAADQPTTTELHLDRTSTFTAFCPFPFQAHTVGTLRTTTYSNGKVVTHAIDFHITYTNPANGKTATTVLAGPVITEPYGPGTVKVTIHGNDGHITVPGEGSVFANVGTFVYVADAVTGAPLQILKSTGQQDPSQFPATCDALA